jgi:hypothetical protein
MPRDLTDLRLFLQDRDIALVGNAASLFEVYHPIDLHEVVVRLNKGVFLSEQQSARAGGRTDVLIVSRLRGPEYFAAAPHLVWASPKLRETIPESESSRMYFYPLERWQILHELLKARPSTGCMAVDLICHLKRKGRLTLYGFDFWKSPTFYTGKIRPGIHSPRSEERIIRKMMTL